MVLSVLFGCKLSRGRCRVCDQRNGSPPTQPVWKRWSPVASSGSVACLHLVLFHLALQKQAEMGEELRFNGEEWCEEEE